MHRTIHLPFQQHSPRNVYVVVEIVCKADNCVLLPLFAKSSQSAGCFL